MENNSARLHRILCELGDSADQVAETLKAQGILGVRNTVRMLNPIVRFVQGSLLISNIGMDLMKPETFRIMLPDRNEVRATIPLPVSEFLDAFNRGAYSELEMPLQSV